MEDNHLNRIGAQVGGERRLWGTNVDGIYITIMVGVHMTIWEKAIRKQREKNKLRQSEQFISRESKASTPKRKS